MKDDPLTSDEKAFRALLANPRAYRVCADQVRAEWRRRNGKCAP
jgi:hypothetical protein